LIRVFSPNPAGTGFMKDRLIVSAGKEAKIPFFRKPQCPALCPWPKSSRFFKTKYEWPVLPLAGDTHANDRDISITQALAL